MPRKPKTAPSKKDVLRDAAAFVKSINLSCEVADAALFNEGTATVNGNSVHVRTFETSCKSGIGYFLIEQPPEAPQGFSCFAAEATRAADVGAGREPGPACSLPANKDVKAMAANVLQGLGTSCQVTGLKSMGQETAANTELTEVACSGGTGYVISNPLPGSTRTLSAQSCTDAFKRGIKCMLTAVAAPTLTLDTFKAELAKHKVACTIENLRLIGREHSKQRHVVEYKCPEQPNGLVALIPSEGNPAPFETISCADAASRFHVICTLTQPH